MSAVERIRRGHCNWILATSIACADYAGPGADLVVTVTTSAASIRPGDTLEIHLEVRNVGERADSIAAVPDCPVLWRIDGPGGVYAGPNGALTAGGEPCTWGADPIRLQPGTAVGITYKWTGQRGTLRVPYELPLGRYTIRASTQPAANIKRMIWSRPIGFDLVARE